MKNPAAKILSLDAALQWRLALRHGQGGTLAVTNGCFDLLHAGHLELLLAARAEADALLVLLNSDASVQSLKGPTRPIIPENDRALLLAGLACVSAVVLFSDARCAAELAALQPDVYVKSADYHGFLDHSEQAALMTAGTRIEFIPVVDGISTSKILARIAGIAGGEFAAPRTPGDGQRAGSANGTIATDFAEAKAKADAETHAPDAGNPSVPTVPSAVLTAAGAGASLSSHSLSTQSAPATAGDHSLPSASRSGGDHDGGSNLPAVGALSLSEVNAKAQWREGAKGETR